MDVSAIMIKSDITQRTRYGGSKLVFSQQYLSKDSTKPYVVGTQKNRLPETILLSTYNIGFKGHKRILVLEIFVLSRTLITACNISPITAIAPSVTMRAITHRLASSVSSSAFDSSIGRSH